MKCLLLHRHSGILFKGVKAMKLIEQMQPIHLDALKEAGNIGAGHAATALSQLLHKKVDMSIPSVKIIPLYEAKTIMGEETLVAALYFDISGEAPGSMFLMFQEKEASDLIYSLTGQTIHLLNGRLDPLAVSALQEAGNILAGSYVSALADFTSLPMQVSIPSFAVDMAGALLDSGLIEASEVGDYAIVIDTVIGETKNSENSTPLGQFFLLPNIEAFEKILKSLGVRLL